MIHSRGYKALALLAVLTCSGAAGQAFATCTLLSAGYVARDIPIEMGYVIIRPGLPVGAVIREWTGEYQNAADIMNCRGPTAGRLIGRFVNAAQSNAVPGLSDVYATDVRGVGIRVSHRVSLFERASSYYPFDVTSTRDRSLIGSTFRVELVKTAEQTGSGRVAPLGRFTSYYTDGSGPGRPLLTASFQGLGATVISPTCEVDAGSRNIAVDFGSVPNTSFMGIGSRAVNRDFDIRLKCGGSGLAEYQSQVGIRLDADQDDSNMTGVLKLGAAANSASRIGIQMVQRDGVSEREVRFGQTLNIGTTTFGDGTLTLPLRARYVQTQAGLVGAGAANGQATFTIQYE